MVDEPPPEKYVLLARYKFVYTISVIFPIKIVIPPDELIIQDSLILGNLVYSKSLKTNN